MKKTSTSLALLAFTSLMFAPSAQAGIFDFDRQKAVFMCPVLLAVVFRQMQLLTESKPPKREFPVRQVHSDIDAEIGSDAFYGASVGAKLPFKYWKYFQPRLELEVSYLENDVEGGSFNGGNQILVAFNQHYLSL